MALVTPVGVGMPISQMSGIPSRLDSAWQN